MSITMASAASLSNQILGNLVLDEWEQIRPHLVNLPTTVRQSLYQPEHAITDLYFVETGLISLIVNIHNDEDVEAEVGIIGSEGLVGVTALLYPNPLMAYQALVQITGNVIRFNAEKARGLLGTCPHFRDNCFRYLDIMVKQTAYVAGCNLRHTVAERLARWLLMTHDRQQTDTLPMTQDFLATMLGVRRPGVSLAASSLQTAGLISQARGRITVLDRKGLEEVACPCYQQIRRLFDGNHN